MSETSFFDESTEQSAVKSQIVQQYFDTWARIITGAANRYRQTEQRIGYVDLFAGPGRYKSGATSTPLLVLQKALESPQYRDRLVTIFNDRDEENVQSLEEAIFSLPGIQRLKIKPAVWNHEIGDQIAQQFERISTIPILAFIDPWGYKGLSLRLVNAFLKDWGCDCIFFFNYSRINAGLSNPRVHEHMCNLFGSERAAALRGDLEPLDPQERASLIMQELSAALRAYGHRYVLPFGFRNASGRRTTHHLILVTKHFKGYNVMKEIMAKASSESPQGVPEFAFIPPAQTKQGLLFDLNRPLDDLKELLIRDFAGRTATMWQIYEEHSVDKPFLARNYKDVLMNLESEARIIANPPAVAPKGQKPRRKGSFGNNVLVTFPK